MNKNLRSVGAYPVLLKFSSEKHERIFRDNFPYGKFYLSRRAAAFTYFGLAAFRLRGADQEKERGFRYLNMSYSDFIREQLLLRVIRFRVAAALLWARLLGVDHD